MNIIDIDEYERKDLEEALEELSFTLFQYRQLIVLQRLSLLFKK